MFFCRSACQNPGLDGTFYFFKFILAQLSVNKILRTNSLLKEFIVDMSDTCDVRRGIQYSEALTQSFYRDPSML